jgi:hypothetical protein
MGIICFASFLELGKSLEGRPRSGKFRIRLLATICNYDKNNGIKRLPGAVVSSTVWPWEFKRSDFFGGGNQVESENIWSHPERGLRREGSCMLDYTVWSPTHRTTNVSDVLFSKMVTFIRRALPRWLHKHRCFWRLLTPKPWFCQTPQNGQFRKDSWGQYTHTWFNLGLSSEVQTNPKWTRFFLGGLTIDTSSSLSRLYHPWYPKYIPFPGFV